MPTTRRDASLAHRDRSTSFAAYYAPYVRTYVRTLSLRPLSLSLYPLSSCIPRFPRAYIDASRERYIYIYIVSARVCVCACVYVHSSLRDTPRRDSSSALSFPFLPRFPKFHASQCTNIINGKVFVYVIGRIVAKGCIHALLDIHALRELRTESDPRESRRKFIYQDGYYVKMRTVVDRSRTLEWDVDRELREFVLSW